MTEAKLEDAQGFSTRVTYTDDKGRQESLVVVTYPVVSTTKKLSRPDEKRSGENEADV